MPKFKLIYASKGSPLYEINSTIWNPARQCYWCLIYLSWIRTQLSWSLSIWLNAGAPQWECPSTIYDTKEPSHFHDSHLWPLLLTWINFNPSMNRKVGDETTYPFLNCNGCTVEVQGWISNFIPHFIVDVVTMIFQISMLELKLNHGATGISYISVYTRFGLMEFLHISFCYLTIKPITAMSLENWCKVKGKLNTTMGADSRFAPSQWETALLCNDVSHWLGANLESALNDDRAMQWATAWGSFSQNTPVSAPQG